MGADVIRFDQHPIDLKVRETSEQFLKGNAIITRAGVLDYWDPKLNKIRREYRPPEEVFHPDSLESLRLAPIVNDHPYDLPDGLITPDTVKTRQIGSIGSNIVALDKSEILAEDIDSSYYVAADLIITALDGLSDVRDKRPALSAGYTCTLEPALPGTGYDFIQRNIRYNHVAIVNRARAGAQARINLDAAHAEILYHEEGFMADNLKTVKLDGVDYQAEAPVIAEYNKATTRADAAEKQLAELKSTLSRVEGERDTAKEQITKLDAEVAELKTKQLDASAIAEKAKRLVAIRSVAEKVGVTNLDSMDELDLMKAVIMQKFPEAKLDAANEAYIQGRYDGILGILDKETANEGSARGVVPVPATSHADSAPVRTAQEARQDMIKSYTEPKGAK